MNRKEVCVITGGGSGMGLAAAKFMPKKKIIVVSGRTEKKLEKAVKELEELGYEAYGKVCDTSVRSQVQNLSEYAESLGEIKTLIHSAGISPSMANPETILRINALGTVYVNQEFSKRMNRGGVIVDVASNSAYVLPMTPDAEMCSLAETDEEEFLNKILEQGKLAPEGYRRSGMIYSISKKFVIWYAQKCAFEYGNYGIRVVSLSPGLIDTDMGQRESQQGNALLASTVEKRMGTPEELGFALAMAADERNGYLSGVDILCDGGSINGKQFQNKIG